MAGEDLIIRLHLKVGDMIRVGGQDYRLAAAVVSEPDRMSGSMNIGLRLMMSRDALARTGLMQLGSRAAERILFKMNPGAPPVDELRKSIKAALPESLVADFRQSHPIITSGLDRATVFLSLVSLIALIVGAIGVGMAMHAHLQQKMDNIAVMKSIGATSNEIIRIYTLQTLMLGVLGGIAGVVVGRGVEEVLPRLITKFFSVGGAMGWHIAASVQGIAVGMLTTLLFTLPPLLAIRKIRPALILRRDMPEARLGWRQRIGEGREALAVGGIILIGIGGVATWLAESPKVGGYFAGGLVTSLLALTGVAWLLLHGHSGVFEAVPLAGAFAGAAGAREFVPARESGAGDFGGAGIGRDVHAERVLDPGFAGRANCADSSSGDAERVSGRDHAGAGRAVEGASRETGWGAGDAGVRAQRQRATREH